MFAFVARIWRLQGRTGTVLNRLFLSSTFGGEIKFGGVADFLSVLFDFRFWLGYLQEKCSLLRVDGLRIFSNGLGCCSNCSQSFGIGSINRIKDRCLRQIAQIFFQHR